MPHQKLSADTARAIAECIAAGERHAGIAQRFGVSAQTVAAIKSGKRWADAIGDDLRTRMNAAPVARVVDTAAAQRIIAALDSGRTGRSIAQEFGISASTVSAIKHGHAWTGVDPELAAGLAEKPTQGKALSESQVAQIKQRLNAGQSSRKVAAEFGVSASTILAIGRGATWAHVAARGGAGAALASLASPDE